MPEIISSEKSFSSPILRERRRKRGWVWRVIMVVMNRDRGIVNANTSTSGGAMVSIIISDPTMVMLLVSTCTTSEDSDVLMVSVS